ncbi:TERF1-interacting nuclear factor 2 [Centroberyx affinis]|uniref:TERF1-interacting nuclear factor 2 n=1 Tax=Centroberyx affinis TaxID=166261 RepID=UPI003A5BB523
MATKKPAENDTTLPFAALQLLAPPVRLVSAALWKVMKQRDVMQYGTVEQFVKSACETVPGLLTFRHQSKLTLGLRGRLILELCSGQDQPDPTMIKQHLERICAPAPSSSSSAHKVRKDIKIEKTVNNFQALVQMLLRDPDERERFFKEEFPADYGPQFDQELEKLLWEFLIRLDQLLPVPNLAQTVSWLSAAPPVLEECARAATQPQLLKILLQHQTCLGHLETAASLPPHMGDSILTSLSLPPSGRVPSNQPTGSTNSSAGQSTTSGPVQESDSTGKRDRTPFLTPVIGLISNEDVPIMISANKRKSRGDQAASSQDATNEGKELEPKGNLKFTVVKRRQKSKDDGVREGDEQVEGERSVPKRSSGMKRKQPDKIQTESEEEEEEEVSVTRNGKKRISRSMRSRVSRLSQCEKDQRTNESGEENIGRDESDRAALSSSMAQLGFKTLKLPGDPSLCSILTSCLHSQPKVLITRLKMTSAGANGRGRGGRISYVQLQDERRKSPVVAHAQNTSNRPRGLEFDFPGLDDKENHPVLPGKSSSPSLQRRNTETCPPPGDGEDFIGDSEDEATKNFRGRLFLKRYYKTKHGTYVPTLREFWKPGKARRDLLSPGNGHR